MAGRFKSLLVLLALLVFLGVMVGRAKRNIPEVAEVSGNQLSFKCAQCQVVTEYQVSGPSRPACSRCGGQVGQVSYHDGNKKP